MSYKVTCPSCGWPIRRDNPTHDKDSITCPSCGEVYPPVWDTEEDSSEPEEAPTPPITPPSLPSQPKNGQARYRVCIFDNSMRGIMTYDEIIALCKRRSLIDSRAKLYPVGRLLGGWKPIGEYSEFNSFVPSECFEAEEYRGRPSVEGEESKRQASVEAKPLPPPPILYLLIKDQQQGPYAFDQIRGMWNSGSITIDTLYWHEGMAEWGPVGALISQQQTDTPPALPASSPPITGMPCPYCSEQITNTATRCKHCGGELLPCPNCKRNVAVETKRKFVGLLRGGVQDTKKCLNCGKQLAGPRW